jgi:hypothetical protein
MQRARHRVLHEQIRPRSTTGSSRVQDFCHQVLIKHSAFYGEDREWIVGCLRLRASAKARGRRNERGNGGGCSALTPGPASADPTPLPQERGGLNRQVQAGVRPPPAARLGLADLEGYACFLSQAKLFSVLRHGSSLWSCSAINQGETVVRAAATVAVKSTSPDPSSTVSQPPPVLALTSLM